jgi:hypothetical protein
VIPYEKITSLKVTARKAKNRLKGAWKYEILGIPDPF